MKGIKVFDNINGYISVELKDIVKYIPFEDFTKCVLLEINAIGNIGDNPTNKELEQKVFDSKMGLDFFWGELKRLALRYTQIIDMTLVVGKDRGKIHFYKTDEDLYKNCEFCLQMIDSSFWVVVAKNNRIIDELEQRFNDVSVFQE
ncbi:MAG: hypothetical protein P0S95_07635 [Rhabdochlamydiaceae bacterium]|nr:hypothetical protein [Candidatus Amphrikana amoebophyrae]